MKRGFCYKVTLRRKNKVKETTLDTLEYTANCAVIRLCEGVPFENVLNPLYFIPR